MVDIMDNEEMEPTDESLDESLEEEAIDAFDDDDDEVELTDESLAEEAIDAFDDDDDEVEATEEAVDSSEVDDDLELTEEDTEEATADSLKVSDDFTYILNDNLNFYLAYKAYYEDRNYEEAIAKFQSTIESEQSQTKNFPGASDFPERVQQPEPNSVIAKSLYWMGEAYIRINQIDKAIEAFEQLARRFRRHYLSLAAQRRVTVLKANYLKEKESV